MLLSISSYFKWLASQDTLPDVIGKTTDDMDQMWGFFDITDVLVPSTNI